MNNIVSTKKITVLLLFLTVVVTINSMTPPEQSRKRPLRDNEQELVLSGNPAKEQAVLQTPASAKLLLESLPLDVRKLIINALSYADDKIQAKELEGIIIQTPSSAQDLGQDQQTRLYTAARNIRSLLMTNKSFLSILNDQEFTEQLINRLAHAYKFPVVDVALALATDAAARWIAVKYDQDKDIKLSAWQRIWTAAAQGDVSVLRFLLTYASDDNKKYLLNSTFGKTSPLIIASQKNQLEAVKYLIKQKNIDLEIKDLYYQTALHKAAINNFENIVRELIQAGADLNTQDDKGNTPLISATVNKHESLVNALIAAKADLNRQNNDGSTALLIAALKNSENIALKLIAAGADVNKQNKSGDTALIWATIQKNETLVNALIAAKADLNVQSNDGNTALLIAAQVNNENIALKLIAAGADVNKQDKFGDTVLMTAVVNNNESLVKVLIAANADVNKQNSDGWTALLFAVYNNFDKIALKLIEAGADVHRKNNRDETPLFLAIYKNNESIVSALIPAGAANNTNVDALLEYAWQFANRQTIQALFSSHLLKNRKVDFNEALPIAAFYGNLDAVQFLIEQGADVNEYAIDNKKALTIARKLDSPNKDAIIKILLDHGAKE